MASRFAAVTNKEISQIIKQAVPEIHEGDEVWFGNFTGKDSPFKVAPSLILEHLTVTHFPS